MRHRGDRPRITYGPTGDGSKIAYHPPCDRVKITYGDPLVTGDVRNLTTGELNARYSRGGGGEMVGWCGFVGREVLDTNR
jgi:hypothetical protein